MKGFTDAVVLSDIDDQDITDIESGTVSVLNSSGRILGFAMTDLGIALASQMQILGQNITLGFTPKLQNYYTYHYVVSVNNFNMDDWNSANNRTESSGFNLDVGAIWSSGPIRIGVAGKNMISHDIQTTMNGHQYTYEVAPLITVGAAFKTQMLTVAADLDLNPQKRFNDVGGTNVKDDTQYFNFGGELNLLNWAQLRAGYKMDLKDSVDDAFTIGAGLAPFGLLHLDLAAELIGKNSYGAIGQLSFTF